MKSVSELFNQVLETTTDNMYCNLPCKVEKVNGNFVDVKVYINDDEPDIVLYNVPIQRQETQRAYIFLGIKQGDRGTLKFFDRSVEGYLQSDFDYNSDERQHDINDRCFELGFIPDKEAYVYPTDNEIEIGLKDKSMKISFGEVSYHDVSTPTITIKSPAIALDGDVFITGNVQCSKTITATGEIIGNSIPLSTHKHSGVRTGNDTSGLPTT